MRLSHFCILLAVILVIAVGVGCGNNKVAEVPSAVASVNGEKITSSEYLTWLSDVRGRDALKALLEGKILMQWAKDEGVAVTDDQVNKQIADMKRVGQYDQAAKQAGEAMLKYQLQVAQARVNLAKKFYGKTVTDKQLQDLYDGMNKQSEMFVHPAGKQVELMGDKDQQKMQDALSELKAGKPMAEVAAKNTDPKFGGENTVVFWASSNQKGMPKPLQDAINSTKVGEYGDVVGVGAEGKPVSQYVVFKVIAERPKDDISFSDAKEQILGAVLLQKAQSDPDFETRFTTKKKAAKIDIEIKRFEDVKYGFMYPPPPQSQMPMMMQPPPK